MIPLFPWWKKYPNVNDEILNLDWIQYTVKHLAEEVANFINLNTIKYANPILWDITSQYEANTIVVDPQTGDAYISVQAVPYGVSLSNTSYWTKIYNYADAINSLEEQIAAANEMLSTTATAARAIGDLVWLNGLLYKVTAPMIAGDTYVSGSNCVKTTIEEELHLLINSVLSMIGDLNNLATTDKSSVVNAINEIVNVISTNIGDLNNLLTIDKTSIVNAINELVGNISTIVNAIGDLTTLKTTDKSSIVAAINEVFDRTNYVYNVKEYGAVGDGVTDDTVAIKAAVNAMKATQKGGVVFFPEGEYLISDTITVEGAETYLGVNYYASRIKCADNMNKPAFASPNDGYQRYWFEMINLGIEANGENQTGTFDLLELRTLNESSIIGVRLNEVKHNGIHFYNSIMPIIKNCIIKGIGTNQGDDTTGIGVFLDVGVNDGYIECVDIGWFGHDAGLYVNNGGNMNLHAVEPWYCETGIALYHSQSNRINSCVCDNSYKNGMIILDTQETVVTNCIFRNSSRLAAGTYNGLIIQDSGINRCNNNVITNCIAHGEESTPNAGYVIDGNCSHIHIKNCLSISNNNHYLKTGIGGVGLDVDLPTVNPANSNLSVDTGGGTITLTAEQASYDVINIYSGAGDGTVIFPEYINKVWQVLNRSANTITINTATGSAITLTAWATATLILDNHNMLKV